jgi:hypothetical protein
VKIDYTIDRKSNIFWQIESFGCRPEKKIGLKSIKISGSATLLCGGGIP